MLALLALACTLQTPTPVDFARLVAELGERATLARFPDPPYRARSVASSASAALEAQSSSGPRTLLEVEGPGVITRLWFADPSGRLRIVVDSEPGDFADAPF